MSVSKSGYYKWKYRNENPNQKELTRQRDINLIKEIHDKHPSHGYRWINAFVRSKNTDKFFSFLIEGNYIILKIITKI